jgi:hypothetical protein
MAGIAIACQRKPSLRCHCMDDISLWMFQFVAFISPPHEPTGIISRIPAPLTRFPVSGSINLCKTLEFCYLHCQAQVKSRLARSNMPLSHKPASKFAVLTLLVAFTITVPTQVLAELELTGRYLGFQFGNMKVDVNGDDGDDFETSTGNIKGIFGGAFTDYLALEGQLGVNINSGSDEGAFNYGLYLKLGKKLGQYKPYLLLGASGYYLYSDTYEDEMLTDASWGAGLELFGTKDLSITFEYLNLINTEVDGLDYKIEIVGIGFTYYFTESGTRADAGRYQFKSSR